MLKRQDAHVFVRQNRRFGVRSIHIEILELDVGLRCALERLRLPLEWACNSQADLYGEHEQDPQRGDRAATSARCPCPGLGSYPVDGCSKRPARPSQG